MIDKAFSVMSAVHTAGSHLAKLAYHSFIPYKLEVEREESVRNIEELVRDVLIHRMDENNDHDGSYRMSVDRTDKNEELTDEEMLQKPGDFFIPHIFFKDIDQNVLWETALEYDKKGIIPKLDETVLDFVHRGNTNLAISSFLKRRNKGLALDASNWVDWKSSVKEEYLASHATEQDMTEANESIPLYMDLTWVPVFVKPVLTMPAAGLTFTLPHYNGLSWVEMLDTYKDRNQYLEILAHELTHAGTVYFDTRRDFLETKAYDVGKGSMLGEYNVAAAKSPSIGSTIFSTIITFGSSGWLNGDRLIKYGVKLKTATEIHVKNKQYQAVRKRLEENFGEKGNYILGRLTADEMDEFFFCDNIQTHIDAKESLKWKLMRHNFRELLEDRY